jgi:hypothetical protein
MKYRMTALLFLAMLIVSQNSKPATLPIQEEGPNAVSFFYSDLGPYGEWIEFEPGIYAWHPVNVDPDWRPYTVGRWVWSDYGWYWVTAEPFGWATYHYGRWFFDDSYGWIWIPDTVWGPAWVEWRSNDDYIGWAPLPPYARFHVTVGIRFTRRWDAPPSYWSFISYDHFTSGRPYRNYVPEDHARRLIATTRSAGRYQIDQNRIIDQGIERNFIQHRTSNRIEAAEVTATHERGVERISSDERGEHINIYRPRSRDIEDVDRKIVARRAEKRSSLDLDHIERYQSVPRSNERHPGGIDRESRQDFFPGQQPQPPIRQDEGRSRIDTRRDRPVRPQRLMPAPRISNPVPRRPKEPKEDNRDGARRRDRF